MDKISIFLVISLMSLASSAQSKEDGKAAFDRLLVAHDSDIMNVVKDNDLICFADKNPDWLASDRFLVVATSEPQDSAWIDAEDSNSGKTIYGSEPAFGKQYGYDAVTVWENEDSELWVSGLTGEWKSYGHYAIKDGRRHWVAFGDIGPVFRCSTSDDKANVIEAITHDATSFAATKKYDNKAKGTTEWNFSIRMSTGRYRETWDFNGTSESLGRCYRAKTLIKPTATAASVPKARTKTETSSH